MDQRLQKSKNYPRRIKMKKIIAELIKSKVFVGYKESKLHKVLPSYMGISLALILPVVMITSLIPIFYTHRL